MSRKQSHRQRRAVVAAIVSTLSFGGITHALRADTAQNVAATATPTALQNAGYGAYTNGAGVIIGQNEIGMPNYAGNAVGSYTLPNGNANLPAANVSWLAGGGTNVRNHPTEVAGIIVSSIPGQAGIATGAAIIAANTSDITIGIVGTNLAGSWGSLNLQTQFQTTQIINMSWGGTAGGTNYTNNGNNYISPFVDYEAAKYNSLVVVAGNEGAAESPSDAYNILNIGALGIRTGSNGAALSYNTYSTYNTTNATADGRIGISLVAPGGDPGPSTSTNTGNFNALPAFNNLFLTTAGGQYEFQGTNNVGRPIYQTDNFNGGNSTASYGIAVDDNGNVPGPPFPAMNPGTNLGGTDRVLSTTLAGTSFAAPLVSGAAAIVEQYGNAFKNNTNFANVPSDALDHRVLKAIMMNGASNTNPDGSPLQYYTLPNGGGVLQSYTQAPIQTNGGNPIAVQLPASYFGGSGTVYARSGLDATVGAGELNLVRSLNNYAAGEQSFGIVRPTGWDFETAPASNSLPTIFNYAFTVSTRATEFDATLAWDSNVSTTANAGAGNTWQPGSTSTASTTLTRSSLVNLDLVLSSTTSLDGPISQVLAYSTSVYDNDQHIYDPAGLAPGTYELDVIDPANAPASTPYGLAWATVPEPASLSVVMFGSLLLLVRKRRSK